MVLDPKYIRQLHPLDLGPDEIADEIERLRDAFTWSLRHTSGKELRRMVGDLHDTSDLEEFIRAINRAQSK